MSKINQIERALEELSGASFHKLANSYLIKKGYKNINPIGTVLSKNKSKVGTPDTLIPGEDGKYIFAEITSQENGIKTKFKKDIKKCLNPEKTGIQTIDVKEIILMHNSEIDPKSFSSLRQSCQSENVNLNIFGLKSIAYDLLEKFPGLAKHYLGIEIDTGQILSPDDFVDTYNKNKLAAPLDTAFFFRKDALKQALSSLKNNELTMITGKAGVGKSRLALECCKQFSEEYADYKIYCVIDRGIDLFDDSKSYFSEPGKFLIYIDDANRITNFRYFADLLLNQREDQEIKIIVTVRDYALDKIELNARQISNKQKISINDFDKEQLVEFLESEYTITNPDYHDQIFKISQGNPRLAVMAAKLAKKENRLSAITDVSNLYGEYFETIRKDLNEIGSPKLFKVAAIISFFRSVDKTKKELLHSIKEVFKIEPTEFWESALQLHELEILDMYEDEVVRTSDQILSTYLFYLAFFKEKVLSIGNLLEHFLGTQKERIIDSLNPIYSAFDGNTINATIQPEVDHLWEKYQSKEDNEGLLLLMQSFWYLKRTETLMHIKNTVKELERDKFNIKELNLEPSSSVNSNTLLSLIANFKYSTEEEFQTALGLLLSYYSKKPSNAPEISYLLIKKFGFTHKSHLNKFHIQRMVISSLWKKTNQGKEHAFTLLFLKVAEYYLRIRHETNESEGRTVKFINFDLPATPQLLELREDLWSKLFLLAEEKGYKNEFLRLLYNYSHSAGLGDRKEVFQADADTIQPYIKQKLDKNSFKHCLICHDYIKLLKRKNINYDKNLPQNLRNETFEIYELLCSSWADGHTDMNHNDYVEFRKNKIQDFFTENDLSDYQNLFEKCHIIEENLYRDNEIRNLIKGITDVLSILSETNSFLFKKVLSHYLSNGNQFKLNPGYLVSSLFKITSHSKAYKLIDKYEYENKEKWLFSYYRNLPEKYVEKSHVDEILELYRVSNRQNLYHSFDYLLKYQNADPKIIVKVIDILHQKLKEEEKYSFVVSGIFNPHSDIQKNLKQIFVDDIELLEDVYLLADDSDKNIDYNADSVSKILDLDSDFLLKYLDYLAKKDKSIFSRNDSRDYTSIWQRKDAFAVMEKAAFRILDYWNDPDIIVGINPLRTFFNPKKKDNKSEEEELEFFKKMITKHAENSELMQLIFNIIVHYDVDTRKELIKDYLAKNPGFEDFEKLRLTSSGISGSPSLVSPLQNRMTFLQSLLSLVNTADFLEHKYHLEQKIKGLRKWIEQEKKREFMRDY